MSYHRNTIRLIRIEYEAIENGWNKKYPRTCFCEEVARKSGEMGNDYPSDKAIEIALKMLEKLKKSNRES